MLIDIIDYGWGKEMRISSEDVDLVGIGQDIHKFWTDLKAKYNAECVGGNSYIDYDAVTYEIADIAIHEFDSHMLYNMPSRSMDCSANKVYRKAGRPAHIKG